MWRLYPGKSAVALYGKPIRGENALIAAFFSGFSERDRGEVLRLIRLMRANIERDWKDAKNS